MKYFSLLFCFLISLMSGCESNEKKQTAETQPVATPTEQLAEKTIADSEVPGFYVGAFGTNKINLCIVKLSDGKVEGYSVVGGNERLFKGEYQKIGTNFACTAKEPGDDRYDGKFEFTIDPKGEIQGSWVPNDSKQASKTYTLIKRTFSYDTQLGKYPQSSTQLLTGEDVANMLKEELRLMRNEMYARHGYSFKMKDIRSHFDQQDWYMPMTTDVRPLLTTIERKNDVLIKHYEKYAEEYYDDYGR